MLELLANQKALDTLPEDLQAILTEATRAASRYMMDDYVYNNALALDQLKQQGVELKRFPDEVLDAMQEQSELVLGELAAQSELNGRIWASMKAFQEQVKPMHEISGEGTVQLALTALTNGAPGSVRFPTSASVCRRTRPTVASKSS